MLRGMNPRGWDAVHAVSVRTYTEGTRVIRFGTFVRRA